MPSADFCTVIPAPRGAGSPDGQPCRSPRVLRTHFHAYACRIYVMAFCASIGFRRFRTAYPAMPPRIRFLFVRPAICLGLPSDSQSPAKPLPLASTSPCRVCGGLPPLSERALPGAPKKNPDGVRVLYTLNVLGETTGTKRSTPAKAIPLSVSNKHTVTGLDVTVYGLAIV